METPFEQFRVASGLSEGDETRQLNTLLYCLGEKAEEVLLSTGINEDERKVYNTVIEKLDSFFKVRKNVIFERARFNRRSQLEGETADQYIMALMQLVESCEYGTLRQDMLRDRIVVGIRDSAMSERLQLDPDLKLDKAMKFVRQREAVHEGQLVLKGTEDGSVMPANVDETKLGRRRPPKRSSVNTKPKPSNPTRRTRCNRCGKDAHPKDKCPAREAICHSCKKKEHYSSQCYTKT